MADESPTKVASVKTTAPAKKKKGRVKISRGKVFINATFNNTIISASDTSGNVVGWSSAGKAGFKGSKKSTPWAGQRTMEDLLQKLKDTGLVEVEIFITGLGSGRESAVRALHSSGFKVLSIQDRTPTAHGGVRPKKARRL